MKKYKLSIKAKMTMPQALLDLSNTKVRFKLSGSFELLSMTGLMTIYKDTLYISNTYSDYELDLKDVKNISISISNEILIYVQNSVIEIKKVRI